MEGKGREGSGDVLYIVMPAYNEEENIEAVAEAWYRMLSGKGADSRLVVADSGSTDSTHEILLRMKARLPQLEIFMDSEKQHGPKLIALYDYAIRQGADYVFQTDSDGQTDPAEFPAFWRRRKKWDALIGYRPVREDGRSRVFIEGVVCLLLRIFFSVKVPDANAPFRLMKSSLLRKYLYKLPENYALPNIMLTAYFVRFGERAGFRRIRFKMRQEGENSIDFGKVFRIGWEALADFWKFREEMR